MAGQRHRIRREVLELAVPTEDLAERLQAAFGAIHQERIAPLIDECLSGLSAPDRIHRIDRLVIDLGVIAAPEPVEDFLARLEPALRRSLSENIGGLESASNRAGVGLGVASRIEILMVFARTGQVPWWTDSSDTRLVDESIAYLTRESPLELVNLIGVLRKIPDALKRIVRHASDETMAAVLEQLGEAARLELGHGSLDALWISGAYRCVPGTAPTGFRNVVWETLVHVVSGMDRGHGPEGFWREALSRIAAKFRSPLRPLADTLAQMSARRQDAAVRKTPLVSALEALRLPFEGSASSREDSDQVSALIPDIATTLARGGWGSEGMDKLLSALRQCAGSVSPQDRQALAEALERLRSGGGAAEAAQLKRLIERVIASAAGKETRSITRAEQQNVDELPETAPDLSFSDVDADYVENAGLVLLWPFLKFFLERRGLVADGRFVDEAARHRAAGLLEFLATGERSPAEYQVTLNKLLCGIEAGRAFDFGEAVSEDEAEECDNLLTAVIGHATILREMTVDGFRGTFLIRKGVLTANAGAWLLRVERKTYDLVLDHFPWSWEWVKLPWMEAPLRVEW